MPPKRHLPEARGLLRRATSRLHSRIDRASVLTSLMDPGVPVSVYRGAMLALESAYAEMDGLLLQGSDLCPVGVPPYLPRLPRLEHDLAAFHMPVRASGSPHVTLHGPQTEAAYLGMRYVVEGAQLGSRMIYRNLFSTFGKDLELFGSFWTPESPLQTSWPFVLKALSEMGTRSSIARAAHSARWTFRQMAGHLISAEQPIDDRKEA